ncbi:hypothetical protein BDV96DRAFT_114088 [Lophiotrema nucula]|uniref:Uncharacterized protein n=1 Tax=Lophiotrema nucula TaxID=690887 RepID=A0A6A5Z5G8_9PLEO|nr:hypothetical protein BDV96DRAFT_114088 [Lophiotrema nucula]
MPDPHQDIITDAVRRAQHLIRTYDPWPDSFPSMIEAEAYVSEVCEWKSFDYVQAPAQDKLSKRTQRKIHFDAAMDAYKAGHFTLDTPPVPKRALDGKDHRPKAETENIILIIADAVQTNARMMEALIGTWPKMFPHIGAARRYLSDACYSKGFRPTRLPGVLDWRMCMFACYNAVRAAYAAGAFKLGEPPAPRPIRKELPTKHNVAIVGRPIIKPPVLKDPKLRTASGSSSVTLVNERPFPTPTPTPSVRFNEEAKQNPARFLLIDIESPTPEVSSIKNETFHELVDDVRRGLIIWDGHTPTWESDSDSESEYDDQLI